MKIFSGTMVISTLALFLTAVIYSLPGMNILCSLQDSLWSCVNYGTLTLFVSLDLALLTAYLCVKAMEGL